MIAALIAVHSVQYFEPPFQSLVCFDTVLVRGSDEAADNGRAHGLILGEGRSLLIDFPELRTGFRPMKSEGATLTLPTLVKGSLRLKAVRLVRQRWDDDAASGRFAEQGVTWRSDAFSPPLDGVSFVIDNSRAVVSGLDAAVDALGAPYSDSFGLLLEFDGQGVVSTYENPWHPAPELRSDSPFDMGSESPVIVRDGPLRTWSVYHPLGVHSIGIYADGQLKQTVKQDDSASNTTLFAWPKAVREGSRHEIRFFGAGGEFVGHSVYFYPDAIVSKFDLGSVYPVLNEAILPSHRTLLSPHGVTAKVVAGPQTQPIGIGRGSGRPNSIYELFLVLNQAEFLKANRLPKDMEVVLIDAAQFPVQGVPDQRQAHSWNWLDHDSEIQVRPGVLTDAFLVECELSQALHRSPALENVESEVSFVVQDSAGVPLDGASVHIAAQGEEPRLVGVTGEFGQTDRRVRMRLFEEKNPFYVVSVDRGAQAYEVALPTELLAYESLRSASHSPVVPVRVPISREEPDWNASSISPVVLRGETRLPVREVFPPRFNMIQLGLGSLVGGSAVSVTTDLTYEFYSAQKVVGVSRSGNLAGASNLEILVQESSESRAQTTVLRDPIVWRRKRWAFGPVEARRVTLRFRHSSHITVNPEDWTLHLSDDQAAMEPRYPMEGLN